MTAFECILCRDEIIKFEDSDNFSKCSNRSFRSILENLLDYNWEIKNSELRFCENCLGLLNELDLAEQTFKSIKQKIMDFCIGYEFKSSRSDACCQTDEAELLKNELYEVKKSTSEISENIEFEVVDVQISKCYICCVSFSTEEKMIEHSKAAHHITIKKSRCVKTNLNNLHSNMRTPCSNKINGRKTKLAKQHSDFKGTIKSVKLRATKKATVKRKIINRKNATKFLKPIALNKLVAYKGTVKHAESNEESEVKTKAKPIYTCEKCLKRWTVADKFDNHVCGEINKQKYICELCGLAYKSKSAFNAHISAHKGVYPYVCSVCSRAFTKKGMLQRHVRIHTGEIRYQCELCGKSFIHNSSFRTHMLLHAGRKDFKCTQCGFALFSKTHLERHMRVHTREKPYPCMLCPKRFAETYNLQTHLKVHAKRQDIQSYSRDDLSKWL